MSGISTFGMMSDVLSDPQADKTKTNRTKRLNSFIRLCDMIFFPEIDYRILIYKKSLAQGITMQDS